MKSSSSENLSLCSTRIIVPDMLHAFSILRPLPLRKKTCRVVAVSGSDLLVLNGLLEGFLFYI